MIKKNEPENTTDVAIQISNVSKTFRLPHERQSNIKGLFIHMFRGRRTFEVQQVLKDVSFQINKGDFFGIVGRNGSGKSTLLKLLAGIYTPDEGRIKVNGGLTPFIELGVGFNPELTGRENVFLNGALLGFGRKEMEAMYDSIVSFAELEKFMDQKLKNYSSGMQVRLAFSIAITAKNDILVFDEVLAVGDEAFQRKCLDTFDRYKAEGQTVVLVSHSMDTVRQYCSRAILIDHGRIIASGNPNEVADVYSTLNQTAIDADKDKMAAEAQHAKVSLNKKGKKTNSFAVGEWGSLKVRWDKDLPVGAVWVDLYKRSGEHITNFISTRDTGHKLSGQSSVTLDIEFDIAPGSYYIDVGLWDSALQQKHLSLYPACEFTITKDWSKTNHKFGGLTYLQSKWD